MVIGEQSLEIMCRDLTDEVVMVHISQLFLNQLFFRFNFINIVCLCVCLWVSMCMCMQVPKDFRGMGFPQEFKLLAVMCCLVWLLGLTQGSSGRAVHALNH